MLRFTFRLATLLRLRESVRDERRGHLAEALRLDDSLAARGAELTAELATIREERIAAVRLGAVQVDRLLDAQRYEIVMRAELAVVEEQRKALSAEIDRRREALVAADRDVRVLEKLRDRQRQRYDEDQNRRDIKLLDEIAALRPPAEELV